MNISFETAASCFRQLGGIQPCVVEELQVREASAAQSLRSRVGVHDYPCLDVYNEDSIAHCAQESWIRNH